MVEQRLSGRLHRTQDAMLIILLLTLVCGFLAAAATVIDRSLKATTGFH